MATPNPFYLQGSQTGNILSNTIPQGFSQTTPYFGDSAPNGIYPAGTSPGPGGTFNAANYTGLTDYEKNKLASIATGNDFFMVDSFLNSLKSKYNDPTTVAGQGEAWLTPDELRAKNNSLQSNLNWGGGASAGGGGSGGGSIGGGLGGTAAGAVGAGGLLSGTSLP